MPKATVPIYADDDFERMAELRMEVSIAERRYDAAKEDVANSSAAFRRAGDDETDSTQETKAALESAQQEFNEFVDAASERAEKWVLETIGHEEFRDLLKAHPPRKVHEGEGDDRKEVTHSDDVGWDINTETFPKALLLFVDPEDADHRTIVEPTFETPEARAKRVRRLSEGQFGSMWSIAYTANKGGVADPKLARF